MNGTLESNGIKRYSKLKYYKGEEKKAGFECGINENIKINIGLFKNYEKIKIKL